LGSIAGERMQTANKSSRVIIVATLSISGDNNKANMLTKQQYDIDISPEIRPTSNRQLYSS
jgi:hypothetical protein